MHRCASNSVKFQFLSFSTEMMAQMQAQQGQTPGAPADVSGEIAGPLEARDKPEIPNTGGGFGALQRKIIEQGNTDGMV